MPRDPRSWLPLGADVFLILLALDDRPRHGFAIIRNVADRTGGSVQLQSGALYRALKHLLRDDLIHECVAPRDEPSADERRRYYRTTRLGRSVISAEAERMAWLAKMAERRPTRATMTTPRPA
jgi:DNA-binding PadR family transcriptional regulator